MARQIVPSRRHSVSSAASFRPQLHDFFHEVRYKLGLVSLDAQDKYENEMLTCAHEVLMDSRDVPSLSRAAAPKE